MLREVQKCSKSDSYVFDSAKKDIKASFKKKNILQMWKPDSLPVSCWGSASRLVSERNTFFVTSKVTVNIEVQLHPIRDLQQNPPLPVLSKLSANKLT